MMMERDPEGLEASESPESALNQYRPPKPEDLPPGMKPLAHVPSNLDEKIKGLLGGTSENPADSPVDQRSSPVDKRSTPHSGSVDWSYLDAIERREIDVSKFPKWAREFLDDIDSPIGRRIKSTGHQSVITLWSVITPIKTASARPAVGLPQ
jgi:hypothetical protein